MSEHTVGDANIGDSIVLRSKDILVTVHSF